MKGIEIKVFVILLSNLLRFVLWKTKFQKSQNQFMKMKKTCSNTDSVLEREYLICQKKIYAATVYTLLKDYFKDIFY